MILHFAQWLQATGVFTYVRGSPFTYPVILSLHMVMILLFGGMILMTDMRLLGLAMRRYSVSSIMDRLRLPKRYGLAVMLLLGFLLFGCKAEEYYYNVFFRTKVILLSLIGLHYLVFRKSVYGNPAELDRIQSTPATAKLAAGLSLVLWISVVCAGRSIGYTPISNTPVPAEDVPVITSAKQPGDSMTARLHYAAGGGEFQEGGAKVRSEASARGLFCGYAQDSRCETPSKVRTESQ